MTIWFTSDTHFWHNNIVTKFDMPNRPWSTVEEMNAELIKRWNECVQPGDRIYHTGDFSFGGKNRQIEILEQLNGEKYLVRGNHDYNTKKEWFAKHWRWIRDRYILRVPDEDAPNGKQTIVLGHCANYVWEESHRGSWNLFGHSHGSLDDWTEDRLSLDVGIDSRFTKGYPISYEQVKEIMLRKKVAFVDHHNSETNI